MRGLSFLCRIAVVVTLARLFCPAAEPDPRGETSSAPEHPTPEMASVLVEPAQRTLDLQLEAFTRAEDNSLQLLGAGSIVVGLAGLTDLSDIERPTAIAFVAAVLAYAGLATVALLQLLRRKRNIPRGAQGLGRSDGLSPAQVQGAWVEVLGTAYVRNQPLLDRKAFYLRLAIAALAVETTAVGFAVTWAAFFSG